jgi:radical SAM superfamily enzyme YgiQ (UPF0313 family)
LSGLEGGSECISLPSLRLLSLRSTSADLLLTMRTLPDRIGAGRPTKKLAGEVGSTNLSPPRNDADRARFSRAHRVSSQLLHLAIPSGPTRGGEGIYPPVIPRGALIVARRARAAGWEPVVFDGYSFPMPDVDFATHCSPAAVIGISIHGATAIEPARKLVDAVRGRVSAVPIVIGGNLANVARDLLSELFPECTICDGGAATALDILEKVRVAGTKTTTDVPSAPDLSWEIPEIQALNAPFERYLDHPDFEYQIPTQVGCPFRCFHCGTGRPGLVARAVARPIESLEEELDWLNGYCATIGRHPPSLWITDETFTASADHAQRVCEVLRSRPVFSWRAQTRVDSVDVDILREMRRAGCRTVAFGVEVPSDSGLTLFGKREAMERVEHAFRACHEVGLRAEAILVFGAPEDQSTFESVFTTLGELGADSLQSYLYHPVPGSPWWRKFGQNLNLHSPQMWTRLDFHSPLITAGSVGVSEEAIARLLASLVWTQKAKTSGIAAWRTRLIDGFECPRCNFRIVAEASHLHDAVEIFRIRGIAGELLLALGSHEMVGYPMANRGNIYEALTWVTDAPIDEALTHVCPRCGILPDFSTSKIGKEASSHV